MREEQQSIIKSIDNLYTKIEQLSKKEEPEDIEEYIKSFIYDPDKINMSNIKIKPFIWLKMY